jgi:hypothetical protein
MSKKSSSGRDGDNSDFAFRLHRGEAILESCLLLSDMTPPHLTTRLLSFCGGISSETPVVIKREPPDNDCNPEPFSNPIARRIIEAGGSHLSGWAIRCVADLWASAEYRTIWVSPDGKPIDVSFDGRHEDETMFLPDRDYFPLRNERSYKLNERLFVEKSEMAASVAMIRSLSAKDRASYEAFAHRTGLTLSQVIRTGMKLGGPRARRIDEYLKERGALDAMLAPSIAAGLLPEPKDWDSYDRRNTVARAMKDEILDWAGSRLRAALSVKVMA